MPKKAKKLPFVFRSPYSRHSFFSLVHQVCVCACLRVNALVPFSIFIFFLFVRTHLYYSHAIYRIKYLSWTFPIQFNACYFDVLTFQWWCCSCCCCWGCRRFKAIHRRKKVNNTHRERERQPEKNTHIYLNVARMHAQNGSEIGKRTVSERQWNGKGKKIIYQLYLVRWI